MCSWVSWDSVGFLVVVLGFSGIRAWGVLGILVSSGISWQTCPKDLELKGSPFGAMTKAGPQENQEVKRLALDN